MPRCNRIMLLIWTCFVGFSFQFGQSAFLGNTTGAANPMSIKENVWASLGTALFVAFVSNLGWRFYEYQKEIMSTWDGIEDMSLSDFENAYGDEARKIGRIGRKGCCALSHEGCGAWEKPITEKEFVDFKETTLMLQGKKTPKVWKMIMLPIIDISFMFLGFVSQLYIWPGNTSVQPSFGEYFLNSYLAPILIGWGQMFATIIVLYFLKLYVCERCCRKKKGEEALLQDPDDSRTPTQEEEGGV